MSVTGFKALVEKLAKDISCMSQTYLKSLSDVDFEQLVVDELTKAGLTDLHYKKGSSAFPDITYRKFGIEVKTTQKDAWSTLGGSIMEGTKVEGLEKIFIIFLKKGGFAEVRIGLYENCLSDIKVTHSPRYEINLDVKEDDTIFHKLGTTYNDFSNSTNKITLLRKYYKEKSSNSVPWWIDPAMEASSMTISNFSSLPKSEQTKTEIELIATHPECLGSEYMRASAYLVTKYNLIDKNLRDRFTAGGTITLQKHGHIFECSRIIKWIDENIYNVYSFLSRNKDLYYTVNGIMENIDAQNSWLETANDAFLKSRNKILLNNREISLTEFIKNYY